MVIGVETRPARHDQRSRARIATQHALEMKSNEIVGIQSKDEARGRALLSALVPGLGQVAQRRFLAATIQFGTVATYVAGALALGGRRALLLALIWNVGSVIDAF